ncbi:hypothetical protein CLU79DRAFT_805407 [Phycomyces nitens]|nr:hypothetical protein CLU79DRAFT_805407 [Phycomyces nitens]
MDINEALVSFFKGRSRTTLYSFVTTHTLLVENYICQFSKAADARKKFALILGDTYKVQDVPVAEKEKEECDDGELNSVNEDDGCSNKRSDDTSDENVVYVFNNNEAEFTSVISSDEGVPGYFKQFKIFQRKAFKKAKTIGLFVNTDLYQIL